MSNIYDKLILAVSIIIAAVLIVLSLGGKSDAADVSIPSVNDTTFQEVSVDASPTPPASWEDPMVNRWGALFDLFTPPKIFYDPENKILVVDNGIVIDTVYDWNLRLVGVTQFLYRIQYEGYVRGPRGERDFIILMTNVETGEGIRGRTTDDFSAHGFSIKSFNVDRELKEGKGYIESVRLVLDDTRIGQEVVLTGRDKRYEPRRLMTLEVVPVPISQKLLSDPSATWTIEFVEDTDGLWEMKNDNDRFFKYPLFQTVFEITEYATDVDSPSVTVERRYVDPDEEETVVVREEKSLPSGNPPTAGTTDGNRQNRSQSQPAATNNQPNDDTGGFDFFQ